MPKRLDFQILLTMALLLAATISVVGWRIAGSQEENLLQTVTDNVQVLAQTHAHSAARFLVVEEYAGLEEYMVEAARLPDILGLQVIEADGRVLFSIDRPPDGTSPVLHYRRKRSPVPAEQETFQRQEEGQLVSWTPIVAGKPLGWLKMTYSLRTAAEMQSLVWQGSLLVGGFWLVMGIGVMVLLLRRPLSAIRSLAEFAHDLNSRKGKQVAVSRSAKEIVQLADALNFASNELLLREQQLLLEQERLAVTIRSIGDGVLACDREGRVMLMNRVAEEMTGWPMQEALGRPFAEVFTIVDGETGEAQQAPLERVIDSGRPLELVEHAVLVAREGTRRTIADSGAPIVSSDGETIGVVVVFRDETARLASEQKRAALEEQLRQSQKMEAIGHLAGGIAHDFNNILTAIIGYTTMVAELTEPDTPARELAQRALKAASRATHLTSGLLAFSRKQKVELKPCDLNLLLRENEKMLHRIIGEDIQLESSLLPEPLIVNADPGLIGQVILNLATNARDAMQGGGLLSISTQRADLDGHSREHDGVLPGTGGHALICFSDSGAGMDEDTVPKIFEPFFTTKSPGKGTGLGLSIVHGIIQQHGGFIRVYSNPGMGTTFKIYLPLSALSPIPVEEEEPPLPVRGGDERILLVEDEAEVRQVQRMMLEGGGYTVVEAANGLEALEVLKDSGGGVDLVVSDVIMPVMNGRELHERLTREYPAIRCLFISGYTADVIQYKGMLAGEIDLLMKPFNANTLLARVREILDRP